MMKPPYITNPSSPSCERSTSTSTCTCNTMLVLASSSTERIDTTADASTSHPNKTAACTPSCWLCPDASGKPLVRDCSCLGHHTAYAHISCIVNYAEKKGREGYESGSSQQHHFHNVLRYFKFCPNCYQEYQNDVKCDLSKAMVSFVERMLHDGTSRAAHLRVFALVDRLFVLCAGSNEEDISEGQLSVPNYCFLWM